MEVTRLDGKLIRFPTTDKLELQGFLAAPRNSKRCILHVHGMTGSFYDSRLAWHIAKAAMRRGLAVFLLNTRGHDMVNGMDTWNRKKYGPIAGTDFERFEDCVTDIGAALAELKRLGFKDFVLSGHSTGCQKITYYQYRRKDRNVKGIALLAPASDYEIARKELGRKFSRVVAYAKRMVRDGKGNVQDKKIPQFFSAKRWLSIADLKNPEARLFDYDGKLSEFSRVTVPILAVFGSKEQHVYRPVERYLSTLGKRTRSLAYTPYIVKGGNHSFHGFEGNAAKVVVGWAAGLK
jgi:predicted alpha/beta-fold hydrolase